MADELTTFLSTLDTLIPARDRASADLLLRTVASDLAADASAMTNRAAIERVHEMVARLEELRARDRRGTMGRGRGAVGGVSGPRAPVRHGDVLMASRIGRRRLLAAGAACVARRDARGPGRGARAAAQGPLRLAFIPQENPEKLLDDITVISDWLAAEIGVPVEGFVTFDHAAAIEALRNRRGHLLHGRAALRPRP